MRQDLVRSRWAAIGAAVAVSLGAGGIGLANAVVDSGPRPIFVPINPCRVMDTRDYDGFNVGPRDTPIGADESYSVHVAGGANGECDEIPAEAVGVALNVTMTDNTADTFLTLYPSDRARPNASNLNALAGKAEPTPNFVTVQLSAGGDFSVYNYQGTANVIADVVGYYEDHTHDDRYLTEADADDLFLTEVEGDDLFLTEAEGDVRYVQVGDPIDVPSFHSGAGAPDGSLGGEGDMYFDTTGRVLYGPKTTGDWGAGTSLAGGSLAGQSRSGALPPATLVAPEPVSLDNEITAFGAGVSYDAGDDEFTIAEAGVYRVSYTATITAGLLGTTLQVRVDGVGQGSPRSVAVLGGSVSDTLLIDVPAGGIVDLAVGGVINVGLAGSATFTIERVA